MKSDPFLTPYRKINSKWITDLHVKVKSAKLLEVSVGGIFHYLGLCKAFLDRTPKAQASEKKIN